MVKNYLLTILCLIGMIFGISAVADAAPDATGFYLGISTGEASLNNDLYIYSLEANARQPELNIQESNDYSGPVSSAYAGYNFTSKKTDFLGSNTLQLGFQLGYVDLGEYRITATYGDGTDSGYRAVDEEVVDILLTSTLYWESGFNLFAKAGVARLSGSYEQEGLRSPRQPEYDPAKQSLSMVAYRPELVVGAGYLIADRCNLYLQYGIIFGDKAPTGDDRFNDSEMVDMPNTLYQAGYLSVGATWFF